jgi:rubrerythrin
MSTWRMRAAAALRFKQNEHEVFRQLLKQTAGELPRDLFRDLAALGRSHVSRLRQMAEGESVEMDEEMAHGLRQMTEQAEAAAGDVGAVLLGLTLKRQACELYEEMQQAAENAFERLFYRELASEERSSLLCLLECQEYLTDPPAYFALKEHVNLD